LRPVVLDRALKSIRPSNWPLKKTWQPPPHQTGLVSMGMLPLATRLLRPFYKVRAINGRKSTRRYYLFLRRAFWPCFQGVSMAPAMRARPVKEVRTWVLTDETTPIVFPLKNCSTHNCVEALTGVLDHFWIQAAVSLPTS
jgi:hypothetical protein